MIIGLIPALNAEETIGAVILKTKHQCDKVIVYDDGSTDMTNEIAEKCGAKVIGNSRNMGKGYALKKLFDEIHDAPEDSFIVTLDADGQHDPNDIPLLIDAIKATGYDFAIGVRTNQKWYRKPTNKIADILTGGHKESQGGFRAYTMKAVRAINIKTNGFGVDSEILESLKNMIATYVQIKVKYNKYSHSKTIARHFLELLNYALSRNPIQYFTVSGITLFILSMYGVVLVGEAWRQYHEIALGTLLFTMTGFLAGIMLFISGVIISTINKTLDKKS